ncbi:MAG: DUF3189 family protein [Firmicutes bacterium]|nr:DUF3189 family protein [Bacillota bacterium]
MIIIYYDVGGAHSVQVAAGIHMGVLPGDRVPNGDELFKMPKYDHTNKNDYGKINYVGTDEYNNQVYTLSCQYASKVVIPAIIDMYEISGGQAKDLLLISTLETINKTMQIGGYTSRRLRWTSIGRPIVVRGTLKAYPQIAELVKQVKERLPEVNSGKVEEMQVAFADELAVKE